MKITHAAIVVGNSVYALPAPYRHHHLIRAVHYLLYAMSQNERMFDTRDQGFVCDSGIYRTRREALTIANAAGQLNQYPVHSDKLFSENVWDGPAPTEDAQVYTAEMTTRTLTQQELNNIGITGEDALTYVPEARSAVPPEKIESMVNLINIHDRPAPVAMPTQTAYYAGSKPIGTADAQISVQLQRRPQ